MLLSACLDGQGLSVAGAQQGLQDVRSSLVKEIFRIWDELPKWLRPQFFLLAGICHAFQNTSDAFFSISLLSRVMLLENVLALLSQEAHCRELFKYIEQDMGAAMFFLFY